MWHAFANILYSCRNQVQPGLSTCVPLLTFMPLLIQAIDWWAAIILVCMENVSHSIECDSELNSRALENCLSACLNEIHYSRVN